MLDVVQPDPWTREREMTVNGAVGGAAGEAATKDVVVVGIDGSPGSRAAAEYALEEAALRGGELRVVAVAPVPDYWAVTYGLSQPPPPTELIDKVRVEARKFTDELVAANPETAAEVTVTVEARTGVAWHQLTEAAKGAALLVLGHRGRGAMASAMLGSVGLQSVLHAQTPVTIVRQEAR
jgi:nucleotide-binding universal stress UspA family protein